MPAAASPVLGLDVIIPFHPPRQHSGGGTTVPILCMGKLMPRGMSHLPKVEEGVELAGAQDFRWQCGLVQGQHGTLSW